MLWLFLPLAWVQSSSAVSSHWICFWTWQAAFVIGALYIAKS